MQMFEEGKKKEGSVHFFFFFLPVGQVRFDSSVSGNNHMLPIFCSASKETKRDRVHIQDFSDQVSSIQMGRQLNGHGVDLWSSADHLGAFGGSAVHPANIPQEENRFTVNLKSQICRCKCKLIRGMKSKKPHII